MGRLFGCDVLFKEVNLPVAALLAETIVALCKTLVACRFLAIDIDRCHALP